MKFVFALLFSSLSILVFAQKQVVLPYTTAVSFSPLALADGDRAVMIGGEYRLKQHWAIVADAGYVFTSNYFDAIKKVSGINARSSIRYYYGRHKQEFLQAQIMYKHINYSMYDWLGKNCVNDVPAYDELQDFTFRKKVWGFNMIAGEIIPIFSNQFFLEIYAGIGVRYKRQDIANVDNACYDYDQIGTVNVYNDKVWMPSIPFSIKLAYVVK